jgi:hypothetical protein
MSNKLPNIFKNSNILNGGNNKSSFYSFREGKSSIVESDDRCSKDDIDYLFNIPVIISTNHGIYECRIISKLKNHILTSNNEKILLSDIREIKVKDHL